MEPSDLDGGVGSFGHKTFMWTYYNNFITAVFDTGEGLRFSNDKDGWQDFYTWALMVTKMV